MSLPPESNYALHRILATLAVLREYGTDELMQVVVNASLPAVATLRLSEFRTLRAKAGKLLVYDGDRYGLFHDRFRWFLVGRPSGRLAMALSHYDEMDTKGRFGPRRVAELHGALADMAARWNHPEFSSLVRDYILQYGPHHQIMAGRVQDAVRTLTDYPTLNERLKSNRSDAWVEDIETVWQAVESGATVENRQALQLWESFAKERRHILERGDEYWPSNKIMLQLTVEHADNSPMTQAAEAWLDEGNCDWLWLRNLRRPRKATANPCLRVLSGHESGVTGACLLDEKRVLSWGEYDPDLRIWDLNSGKTLAVFGDAEDGIEGALVLEDGSILVWHDILAIWDNNGEENLEEFEGHKKLIVGATELSDGRLLSWSWDKTLRLWDRQTCECLTIMKGHKEWVRGALELSGGNILSSSGDGTLRLWDGKTGAFLAVMKGHNPKAIDDYSTDIDLKRDLEIGDTPGGVKKAVELSNGNILSWSGDDTFRLWEGDTGEPIYVFKHGDADENSGADAKELSDGRLLFLHADSICLWDATTGELLKVLFEDEVDDDETDDEEVDVFVPIGILSLSDGNILVWSEDSMRLWDGQSGEVLKEVSDDYTIEAAFELSDGKILTWPETGSLTLWDLAKGEPLGELSGHEGEINSIMCLPEGNILTWAEDANLRLWNPRLAEENERLEGQTGGLSFAKLLPDGRVLTGGADKEIGVWDAETGEVIVGLEAVSQKPDAFTLKSGHLLVTSNPGEITVWDGKTYDQLTEFFLDFGDDEDLLPFNAYGIVELPDNRVLSFGGIDSSGDPRGVILLFENIIDESRDEPDFIFETGSKGTLTALDHHVFLDGRMLLRELSGKSIYIFDINFNEFIYSVTRLDGHSDEVEGMTVLSCGRILSWSKDGTLCLWDPNANPDVSEETIESAFYENSTFVRGKLSPLLKFKGHKREVGEAVETADGKIVSSGHDGTVRIWDKDTGKQLALLELGDNWTCADYLTPLRDGRLLFRNYALMCVWNPEIGRLELEMTYGDAIMQQPELIANCERAKEKKGNHFFDPVRLCDIKLGHWLAVDDLANKWLGVTDLDKPGGAFARWYGDSTGRVVKLHKSGILTISQESGYVFALQLQRGNVPVTLSEADGMYKPLRNEKE